jgi:hypothetical protein
MVSVTKWGFANSQQFILLPRQKAPFQMPPSMAHDALPRTSQDQQPVTIPRPIISANLQRLSTSDKRAAAAVR